MSDKDLAELRRDYSNRALELESTAPTPVLQFEQWFAEALQAGEVEPNGMSLATVDSSGTPSNRIVLLKGIDEGGLCFYTNYQSRKALALDSTRRAAVCFWWTTLVRQVRAEGTIERVSEAESEAYFSSRPRASQLGALASDQSRPLASRGDLEARFAELEQHYAGREVPRPEHWGGYRLIPERFEFWQGRASRLHDRIEYQRSGHIWCRQRLAP